VTNENVVTALDILSGKKVAGKNVLVIGGGSVGVETSMNLIIQKYS
jgi:alkyl hydroperoxide reductase subunit AhpF